MTIHRARRLPVHHGPAAWSALLPRHEPPDVLDAPITADFAIIGAGFAGLSAARRLKKLHPGAKIVVLEAGQLAEGASGRNSGFMIDLPHELTSHDYAGHTHAGNGAAHDRSIITLNRAAIGFAADAVQDYDIDAAYFDRAGKVNGAASAAADALNQSYAAHLAKLGEESERLDAADMFSLTGSRHYVSGLFTSGTVLIHPAGYIRGLAKGLRRAGVLVCEQSPVTELRRAQADWVLTTPRGRVTAPVAILANNGHLESFGFAKNRLMHVFLYASMTAEIGSDMLARLGGKPRWGLTPSDPMGTTIRRIDTAQGGNRLVIRTCASFCPEMETNAAALARAAWIHRQKFVDRFPDLAGIRMEFSWAGHLCLSRNGVSVVGELEPGLYAACCQNGLGAVRGTMAGIGVAELASGAQSAISAHFATEPEPARLPPGALSRPAANAYLRWREWRARTE